MLGRGDISDDLVVINFSISYFRSFKSANIIRSVFMNDIYLHLHFKGNRK